MPSATRAVCLPYLHNPSYFSVPSTIIRSALSIGCINYVLQICNLPFTVPKLIINAIVVAVDKSKVVLLGILLKFFTENLPKIC